MKHEYYMKSKGRLIVACAALAMAHRDGPATSDELPARIHHPVVVRRTMARPVTGLWCSSDMAAGCAGAGFSLG
jgi:hypothetical protein